MALQIMMVALGLSHRGDVTREFILGKGVNDSRNLGDSGKWTFLGPL